jgi:phosphoribosylformimino-5-aminoimidazole carboxamide ribotide isomerase
MLLIPSIDLRGGRCVRLREGDFAAETAYDIEPAALLERYQTLGARWLHVVDLDGAKRGVAVNREVIEGLARHSTLCLQVGGGVRSAAVIDTLLSLGVARVVVGSAAAQRPAEVATWLKGFGAERLCVAFDVRIAPEGEPQVHTDGWTVNSATSLWSAIEAFSEGELKHVLCTDIGRDGTLRGPNLDLYRAGLARFPKLAWQASGGIRHAADLAALGCLGVAAAVSGTALLEERIPNRELQPYLAERASSSLRSARAGV